jgi:levansucrase
MKEKSLRSDERQTPPGVSRWEPGSFAHQPALPLVTEGDAVPILPEFDLWDFWPLQHEDGSTASKGGCTWWFFLSAPRFPDPGERHGVARIRLVSHGSDGWRDHGNALPEDASPGSREWAGSAVLKDDGKTVMLFFTAAGRRGGEFSFEQRMFVTRGAVGAQGPGEWQLPEELFVSDGIRYVLVSQTEGRAGEIKAFRDPAWFRDPLTEKRHILFSGSAGWSDDLFNGVVGLATLRGDTWHLEDPLIEAVGVNNELERPHVVFRTNRYYLFWCTQKRTFSPAVEAGPNGLYAMVAESIYGPWLPVNGNGLVAANPTAEPTQAYSWWVTGEGVVYSFIDHWGMAGRRFEDHPELVRSQFGGTPAPIFQLEFDGDRITIGRDAG